MKHFLTLLLFIFASLSCRSQTTTLWIVRHAEKDTMNTRDADPALSPAGRQRSKDLALYLHRNKPAIIYGHSNTVRNY